MSDAYREPIEDDMTEDALRAKFVGGGNGHLVRRGGSEVVPVDVAGEFANISTEMPTVESAQIAVPQASDSEVAPERVEVETNRDSMYGRIMSKIRTKKGNTKDGDNAPHAHTVARDARTGAMHTDADSQITHLVDLATTKGALHAVKVAQHMENYYILDVLHDKMLSDKLHDALVAKGLI